MKHIINAIIVCLVLLTVMAGCTDIFDPSQGETPANGTGKVRLSITGTGERTILPETPEFTKYEIIFEPLDGQDGHPDVTVDDGTASTTVQLASGNWKITAKGYVTISGIVDINDDDYRAAQGSENITVNAGQTHDLSIDLKGGVQAGEKGIVEWDVKLPDDAQGANMKILTLGGTEVQSVNLMDTPGGTRAIDAGYYLITLSLDNQPPKAEVLHIYGYLTSRIERRLSNAPVFYAIYDLADYLDKVPDNTANTPYDIILYGLNIENDFLQRYDYLYKLYDSLNGKYVNLDLSDCKGQSIPDTLPAYANSRSDRDKIVSITLPSGFTSIGDSAFSYCTNLALTELPAGLTTIGGYAFSYCTSLALTGLPADLTSIGEQAFRNCAKLALAELPAGITSIGDNAFSNCTKLALTELPAGVTSISYETFYGCTGLALMELPSGLASIDRDAFRNCTSLALVICHADTPPALEPSVFSLTRPNLQIKVPAGRVAAYEAAKGWSDYASRIVGIGEYPINVVFSGPTERVIPITRIIDNNLSQSGGGSITLKITEDFDGYEWYIGETKVNTVKEVTLQADSTAFTAGSNWITVVVYEGTASGATPYSGVFTIWVNE